MCGAIAFLAEKTISWWCQCLCMTMYEALHSSVCVLQPKADWIEVQPYRAFTAIHCCARKGPHGDSTGLAWWMANVCFIAVETAITVKRPRLVMQNSTHIMSQSLFCQRLQRYCTQWHLPHFCPWNTHKAQAQQGPVLWLPCWQPVFCSTAQHFDDVLHLFVLTREASLLLSKW